MRKCSKCEYHDTEECLDIIHRDNHGSMASEGVVNPDVLCRAMRAIVRLALKKSKCPTSVRNCRMKKVNGGYTQNCVQCQIEWALRG